MRSVTPPIRTGELTERLRRHYLRPGAMPGGVFIPEVGVNGSWTSTDGQSAGKPRRCDALYVGFTSASGRILVGHEIKVSRSDWRHELDQPGKADAWADQCHAWYVVAPSTEIVPPEELPHGWGLMVIDPRTRTRLKIAVKATVHTDRQPAWWAVRSMTARLDTLQWTAIETEVHKQVDARMVEHEKHREQAARIGAGRDDALAAKLRALRADLAQCRVYLDDDALLAAAGQLLRDQHAASALRHEISDRLRALHQLTDPISEYLGPLAELDRQIRSETP